MKKKQQTNSQSINHLDEEGDLFMVCNLTHDTYIEGGNGLLFKFCCYKSDITI